MNPLSPDQLSSQLPLLRKQGPVYLIGAGGCGMSGLGHLLLDLGYAVAGSDLTINQEIRQLIARGVCIHQGHQAAQIDQCKPALVVYSSAIRPENPELIRAQEIAIPLARRAALLSALLRGQCGVCIAGMHGKTTTTALLAFALEQLQLQPSYAIGGIVPQLQRHACFRDGGEPGARKSFFVVETDESDGTLVQFAPEHAIILNIEEEHLDYYPDLHAIRSEFLQFANQTRGRLIYSADDPQLRDLLTRRPGAVSYGFDSRADYRIEKLANQEGAQTPRRSRFAMWRGGRLLGEFSLRLMGDQNISNAAAVIAFLAEAGIEAGAMARALGAFRGAARRQQELFRDHRFRLFEDYGHHPSEIRATLKALRHLGTDRMLVAFQPHRYSRTKHLLKQFAASFAEADRLWLTDIYAASEPEILGVTGAALAQAVAAHHPSVQFTPEVSQLSSAIRAAMQPGDLVLFLGAGDITRAAHELANRLRQERPMMKEQLLNRLSERLTRQTILRCDEPLAKRTSLRVGGRADFYVEPASEEDLAVVLQFCSEQQLPAVILGRGSNLLIKDGGVRGMVVCLAHPHFGRLEIQGERILCGAGTRLKAVSVEAKRAALAGLEFLEGIPGSVGGGLRMNAGAMGSSMFDVVESVRFMDTSGQIHERPASAIQVEYRSCPLLKQNIALAAVFKGRRAPLSEIEARMKAFSQRRWDSQPASPSAGCIFKNPAAIPAGKLIEELGLKGTRVGGAVVSDAHGNFIVNEGHATAQDVLDLIELLKERARAGRGIELETEVQIIGED